MLKIRLVSLALLVALLGAFVVAPLSGRTDSVAAQEESTGIAVTGSYTDEVGGTGTFVGTLTLDRFVRQGADVLAVGTLTGTLTDSLGNVTEIPATVVELLLTEVSGSCDVLHLALGPLDLDLLGLVVHLDQVVLDVTAESGAGNLLGNLLCTVTGLLDTPASGGALVALLNRLLGLLG